MEPTPLRTLDALILLAHDDRTGDCLISPRSWEQVVTAAAMIELVEDGVARLEPVGGSSTIHATGLPASRPEMARLLAHADGKDFVRAASGGPGLLPGMRGVVDDVLDARHDALASAGLLSPQERTLLGIVTEVRWRQGERREIEAALQARMLDAIEGRAPLDAESATLLAILQPTGALPAIFPTLDRRMVIERAGALVGSSWLASAIRSIQDRFTASGMGRAPFEQGLIS